MDRIHWGRVIAAAILLEVAITALVTPFGMIYGNPLSPAPGEQMNPVPYFVAAAAGCAVLGFLFGWWAARKAASRFALHGLLVGLAATILYVALGSLVPGGLPAIIAAYGAGLYLLFNVLRILGCWAGGIYEGRRRHA